ncbi:MAG TPA: hypothetical protein VH092_23015 [Urbifossiella sp.]|jgi:hypothetical protein|nr:hypothetical protein [Urbifossiella sp.]
MPLPRRLTFRFRRKCRPDLTVNQILDWCDEYHARVKRWPTRKSGTACLPDTSWAAVDGALQKGARGLPGGSSLAKLLLAHRGVRHKNFLPPLPVPVILAWADAHRRRTGDWPFDKAGPIPEAPGETWLTVEHALSRGRRGLPGGSTVAQVLEAHRGVRNHLNLPPLTPDLILRWADTHKARTGKWPVQGSGPVHGVPDQTWNAVDTALSVGVRGLPGGSSLACLLEECRGARNQRHIPAYTPEQILVWADAYKAREGKWPTARGGPIPEAPGETWLAVASALVYGKRGLPGGDSISRLLVRSRGWRNKQAAPRLTVEQIRGWVIAHFRRVGNWPTRESGPIHDAPGETWTAADIGLKRGQRGLPGGSSLSQLVRQCPESPPAIT